MTSVRAWGYCATAALAVAALVLVATENWHPPRFLLSSTEKTVEKKSVRDPTALQFFLVDEDAAHSNAFAQAVSVDGAARAAGIDVQPELWGSDADGVQHSSYNASGPTCDVLARYLADLGVRVPKVAVPPGRHMYFEAVATREGKVTSCSTVLVVDAVLLDGSMVADAQVFLDDVTRAAELLVTFTEAGTRRFAEVTRANIGRKLAIVVDGQVSSAPVIETEITGGKSDIRMGRGDLAAVRVAAEKLASRLREGGPGLPNAALLASLDLRLALAALTALLVLAAGLAGRAFQVEAIVARPAVAQKSWGRLGITALVVAAVVVLQGAFAARVPVPFVDFPRLGPDAEKATPGVFSLGLSPIVAGMILVELLVLLVPRWRPLRRSRRTQLTWWGVTVGIGLALVQASLIVTWLRQPLAGEPVLAVGIVPALTVVLTLVAGTGFPCILAGVVARYGLGNGIAVVYLAGALSHLQRDTLELRTLLSFIAIAVLTAWVLRRRAVERLPTVGLLPWYALVFNLAVGFPKGDWDPWLALIQGQTVLAVPVLVGGSFLVAILLGTARHVRALLVSIAYLVAAYLVAFIGGRTDGILMALATALVLDLASELRHRPDGALALRSFVEENEAQALADELAAAGIESTLRGANLALMLQVLGPYATIDVMVPRVSIEGAVRIRDGLGTARRDLETTSNS